MQPADVIVVLGGTMYERQLEAVDLYRDGLAKRICLFREIADDGEIELQRRGIPYARSVDMQIDVMTRLGVPRDAITILDEADSTKDEADHVSELVREKHFSRVLIITSKQHTRRARMVMNQRMAPLGVQVIVRGTRYDKSDTAHWWRNRGTLRFTLFESQRLFGYWIGVAD